MEPGNHSAQARENDRAVYARKKGECAFKRSVTSPLVAPVSEMNVYRTPRKKNERSKFNGTPEELVLVLHELGVKEVYCGGTHTEPLQVSHEGGKERMMCIELYLACRGACGPSVSVTVGARLGVLRHGKKNGCRRQDTRHTGAINDKVVVLIFSDFLLEPVHILQEVSALPPKTLGFAAQEMRKEQTHVLEAVDEPTIGPIAELAHHVVD